MSTHSDSDETDWFNQDETNILSNVQKSIQKQDSVDSIEYFKTPCALDDLIKPQVISSSAKNKKSRLSTSDLRKVSELPPIDAFLYVVANDEKDFFTNQLATNDSYERLLLYLRTLLAICNLELPGFHSELLHRLVRDDDLLEHFRVITSKVFSKRFKSLWSNDSDVDEILQSIQTVFLQTHLAGVLTDKALEVIHQIKKTIDNSDFSSMLSRNCCKEFARHMEQIIEEVKNKTEQNVNGSLTKDEIYPTLDELNGINNTFEVNDKTSLEELEKLGNDHYINQTKQYLFKQKQLLREDFLIPLRTCFEILKKNGNFDDIPQLTVHQDVVIVVNDQFLSAHRHEMIFVDILGSKRNDGKISKGTAKKIRNSFQQIKTGALLCFSSNTNFENIVFATVTYTDAELLRDGYIGIDVVRQYNIGNIYGQEMIMFESPAFFEPYNNVYNFLTQCNPVDFPMKNYIVHGENSVQFPGYLTPNKVYSLQGVRFKPHKNELPTFKKPLLNPSQLNAYKSALRSDLTLIQGPPGTGKTHLSLQLVRTFIESSTTSSPLLLITYTNESLDKFLLKLSPYTDSIIRFGSRSRQPDIAKYNLVNQVDKNMVNPHLKRLYFNTDLKFKEKFKELLVLHNEFDGTDEAYLNIQLVHSELRHISLKLNTIKHMFQFYEVRNKSIIAMTTTCAAKTNFLFRLLKISTVMFEEAAEILESHVLACLTPFIQHVIMIGDHMQLKPYTSNYQHNRSNELNVSLFERLIVSNNFPMNILNVQYRMRPEIASLLVPTIYTDLINANEVKSYESIRSMSTNLFAVTHVKGEQKAENETSVHNPFEIKKIVELAEYLITVGQYTSADIVILSPYISQIQLIKEKLGNCKFCKEMKTIRVMTVDSFQGLESNIVLLSLVRSNSNGNIGFLKEQNRICVALSRAKLGLYIVGNMRLFASSSDTWQEIVDKLTALEAIGNDFP